MAVAHKNLLVVLHSSEMSPETPRVTTHSHNARARKHLIEIAHYEGRFAVDVYFSVIMLTIHPLYVTWIVQTKVLQDNPLELVLL